MRCVGVTFPGTGLACLLLLLTGAAPASAGPWARGAGEAFVSLRIAAEAPPAELRGGLWEPETALNLYGEIGLGRRLTLVADLGGGADSRMARGSLRYSFSDPDAAWQVAVEGGLGARAVGEADPRALVRLGASVGRGIAPGGGGWPMPLVHDGGWAVLEAVAMLDAGGGGGGGGDTIWQVEGTLGLRLTGRLAGAMALKAEEWPGADLLVTFMPSAILELGEGTSVQLGGQVVLEGGDAVGLSLSVWRSF